MTKEQKEIQEIEITEFVTIDSLDLAGGFTCDVETGICGPTAEVKTEKTEEHENENNHMV